MTNETHQNQPKLTSTTTAAILASGTSDGQRILEAVSDIVTGMITDNERKFTAHEWRTMVDVLHDTTTHPPTTLHLPQGMRGLERLLNLIQESEKYDGLSSRMHISLEQLKNKIDTLDRRAVACMLATLEFGLRYFPTQLDSYAWWTVEARAETSEATAVSTASRDGRSNQNNQGKVTRRRRSTPTVPETQAKPALSPATNGQQKEVVATE